MYIYLQLLLKNGDGRGIIPILYVPVDDAGILTLFVFYVGWSVGHQCHCICS